MKKHIYVIVLLMLSAMAACTLPDKPSLATDTPGLVPLEAVTLEPPPVATPMVTPDIWGEPDLVVTGAEEVVFDWTNDRCEDENIPDLAVRAFRNGDDQVNLLLAHPNTYRMIGPRLDALRMDCDPVSKSLKLADPAMFADRTWIASTYTTDGLTVYALGHNEYQGHTHPGYCPPAEYFPCWYNTITLFVSTDGGVTFLPAADPPGHFVAGLPVQYQAGDGPYGLRAPSNIIQGPDGFFYAFVNLASERSERQYVCAMRTKDLGDPASWRFWDGAGFEGRFINPYLEPDADPADHLCQPYFPDQIGHSLNESITYNTVMERFVLIGISADTIDGREVWGFYYSTSRDLQDWTRRELLMEVPLPWTVEDAGSDLSFLYPSLLDPDSADLNFGTTDDEAYLYFTRHNFGQGSLDRDLIRVPVKFVP
jgi:hypothetical protein